jgi:hypothetical protein
MFPFMIPMLLGAGLGAATSRKPLKGALLGAGMGALGGYGAGLLGGAGAAGGAAAMGPSLPTGAVIPELAKYQTGGLLGGLNTAASYAKPIGQAMSAAQQAGVIGQEPAQPSPVIQPQINPQTLPALSEQLQSLMQQQEQMNMARRKQRQSLLGVA